MPTTLFLGSRAGLGGTGPTWRGRSATADANHGKKSINSSHPRGDRHPRMNVLHQGRSSRGDIIWNMACVWTHTCPHRYTSFPTQRFLGPPLSTLSWRQKSNGPEDPHVSPHPRGGVLTGNDKLLECLDPRTSLQRAIILVPHRLSGRNQIGINLQTCHHPHSGSLQFLRGVGSFSRGDMPVSLSIEKAACNRLGETSSYLTSTRYYRLNHGIKYLGAEELAYRRGTSHQTSSHCSSVRSQHTSCPASPCLWASRVRQQRERKTPPWCIVVAIVVTIQQKTNASQRHHLPVCPPFDDPRLPSPHPLNPGLSVR